MAAAKASANTDLDLKPRITVIGVGGAGGNAVNNMIRAKLEGVEFVVANTDAQALAQSLVDSPHRIQLGLNVTQGLGAGSKPDVGRASAEESHDDVLSHIKGSNMVFITAGMGGGTGTGAAPVIARAARESGILTVGVVTKPFHFEGTHRARTAERGIEELQQYVDTLIIIPNQNLFRIANERTTFADAFKMADDVLYSGVRGVTDLMMMPGLINLDFADIRAVMAEMGKAMMGTGEAEGDRRALDAAEAAISNPLLDDVSMKGARGVLINITGGFDMTLYEVDEAANRIRDEVDPEANIIFGSTFDEKLNGRIRVSVVATGIGGQVMTSHASSHPTTFRPQSVQQPEPVPAARDFGFPFSAAGQKPTIFSTPSAQPTTAPVTTADFPKPSFPQQLKQAAFENSPSTHSFEEQSQSIPQPEVLLAQENYSESVSAPVLKAEEDHALSSFGSSGAQEPVAERRRPTSLFERFTGVARNKTAAETQPKGNSEHLSAEDDLLEIPAFLRRGNN